MTADEKEKTLEELRKLLEIDVRTLPFSDLVQWVAAPLSVELISGFVEAACDIVPPEGQEAVRPFREYMKQQRVLWNEVATKAAAELERRLTGKSA